MLETILKANSLIAAKQHRDENWEGHTYKRGRERERQADRQKERQTNRGREKGVGVDLQALQELFLQL